MKFRHLQNPLNVRSEKSFNNTDNPSVFGGLHPLVPPTGPWPRWGPEAVPRHLAEFRPQTQNPGSVPESSNNNNILLHLKIKRIHIGFIIIVY